MLPEIQALLTCIERQHGVRIPYACEELVARAEEQLVEVQAALEASTLPDAPDRDQVNALLVELREIAVA